MNYMFGIEYKEERCIDCGIKFSQWKENHWEECNQCRIARSLARLVVLFEERVG